MSNESKLVEAALRGDESGVRALLALEPTLPERSIATACALARVDAVEALLDERPDDAAAETGPRAWPPMLYVCASRLALDDAARIDIARALVQRGAAPNQSVAAPDLMGGERTALSASIEHAASLALFDALIELGAKLDFPAVGAASRRQGAPGDPHRYLRRVLALHPPDWQLHATLAELLLREDPAAVRMLLDAGASPNVSGGWGRSGTTLHQAIAHGRSRAVIELLLERGGDIAARDRDGRTALAIALRCAHDEAAELLRARGAREDEASALDRAVGTCTHGEPAELPPGASLRRTDHQMLAWAVASGRDAALPRLIALGLDPNVPEDAGDLPLHLAAARGELALVELLLSAGARAEARDISGRGAVDASRTCADASAQQAVIERLVAAGADPAGAYPDVAHEAPERVASFERAVDAVVDGELDELRRMLAAEPGLVHRRSARPHHATLLNYLGANGVEAERQKPMPHAPECARVLLAAGAEADALCATYGGGPANTTLGLAASSGWPAEAGVQGELIRVLVEAGANPDGLDEDGSPLATAIAFRQPQAVAELARHAQLDNVVFAAAGGRLDLVEREVDERGRQRPGAGHCRVPWLHMSTDPEIAPRQALAHAAGCGQLAVARALIERGVSVNLDPKHGVPALNEAAYAGHVEIVELLLDHGADPTLGNDEGQSALDFARDRGHVEVLALLEAHVRAR